MADHVVGTDFFIEVARRSFPVFLGTHRNSFAPNVPATERVIWPLIATLDRPFLSAASALDIVSTSANDTSAGTGARTLLVQGVDGSYAGINEVINLNGTTPVTTVNSFLHINRVFVIDTGSGRTNAGQINITVGATQYEVVRAGKGRSESSAYTTSASEQAFILNFQGSSEAGKTIEINSFFDSPNSLFGSLPINSKFLVNTLILNETATAVLFPSTPLIPPKTTFYSTAKSTAGVDPDLSISFALLLEFV